jgi:hypothetical protein
MSVSDYTYRNEDNNVIITVIIIIIMKNCKPQMQERMFYCGGLALLLCNREIHGLILDQKIG